MKKQCNFLVFIGLLLFTACTEDIIIEKVEGETMVGVEASFTDELKNHEAILSYTTDLYFTEEIQMVSGATVYVTDGEDTLYYHESMDQPGHYFTDLVAGKRNRFYRFCADIPDEYEGVLHIFSESYLGDNVDVIDSLVVKPFNGTQDSLPNVFFGDTIEWVYPYFQSLPDQTVVYMPMIYLNDSLITDTLGKSMIIPIGGYAGYYVNGPEMQEENKEIPVYYFMKNNLSEGDRIRVDLLNVPMEYVYFYYSIILSNSSNPMLGAPSNVESNIQPEGRAVGWFLTASVVSAETIFKDEY